MFVRATIVIVLVCMFDSGECCLGNFRGYDKMRAPDRNFENSFETNKNKPDHVPKVFDKTENYEDCKSRGDINLTLFLKEVIIKVAPPCVLHLKFTQIGSPTEKYQELCLRPTAEFDEVNKYGFSPLVRLSKPYPFPLHITNFRHTFIRLHQLTLKQEIWQGKIITSLI